MNKFIRTLTILFDTEIPFKEIPLFRGAVIKALGDKASLLYHNHTSDSTFRYSYPLIQYKRIQGKAAIVCIEEAVDLIGQLLTETDGHLIIGEREVTLQASRFQPSRLLLQTWANPFRYHISQWLPLNTKNYQLYKGMDCAVERLTLLESILKANLLSMLKGLDIHLEQELTLKLTKISDSYLLYNKGIGMTAFDADFLCNLTIPNNVGIGKNASIGFGVVHQEKKQKEEMNQ